MSKENYDPIYDEQGLRIRISMMLNLFAAKYDRFYTQAENKVLSFISNLGRSGKAFEAMTKKTEDHLVGGLNKIRKSAGDREHKLIRNDVIIYTIVLIIVLVVLLLAFS